MRKTFRLFFLIAMLLGLAAGQALPVVACGKADPCGDCCKAKNATCCKKASAPARSTPAQIAASSVDLKQAVVPVLICLGAQPCLTLQSVAVCERAFARQPVQHRLDVTCIRLI